MEIQSSWMQEGKLEHVDWKRKTYSYKYIYTRQISPSSHAEESKTPLSKEETTNDDQQSNRRERTRCSI